MGWDPIGSAILEWFHQMEQYVCLLGTYHIILPPEWRDENARIRAKIRHAECLRQSEKHHTPILLDCLFPRFYALLPGLIEVLAEVPLLTAIPSNERQNTAIRLTLGIRKFEDQVDDFLSSDDCQQVFQPSDAHLRSNHSKCCPPFPLTPLFLQYPPSATLRILAIGMKLYTRAVVTPPIRSALGDSAKLVDWRDGEEPAIDLCRTFEALERAITSGHDESGGYESLLPLPAFLIMATTFCPPALRSWLWCKLVHFEELGNFHFESLKRPLAKLWEMPELVSEKHLPLQDSPTAEILETVQTVFDDLSLDKEDRVGTITEVEDESSDPVSNSRGTIGLLS
jgi:hypothetical protein